MVKKKSTHSPKTLPIKTLQIQLPLQVHRQLERLVKEGWFRSHQDVVELALRKFLDSHQPELMEKSIREDVQWGIHGET